MTINQHVDYFTTILMYKIINKSCPDNLQKNFEYIKNKLQFNTRSAVNGNLSIPKLSTKTGQRSFLYRGVHAWSSLSVDARAKLKKFTSGIIFRFFPLFFLILRLLYTFKGDLRPSDVARLV